MITQTFNLLFNTKDITNHGSGISIIDFYYYNISNINQIWAN